MTYLGISLTKEVKDSSNKILKPLKKEAEEHTRRQKESSCLRIGRSKIVEKANVQKAIYRFNYKSKSPWHSSQN